MNNYDLILLPLVACGAVFLFLMQLRRVCGLRKPVEQTGRAFDARHLVPCLHQVREGYVAEVQARAHETVYHDELLHHARQAVSALAFFRGLKPQPPQDDGSNHAA